MKPFFKRIEPDDPRLIAGTFILLSGGIVCLLDFAINFYSSRPSPRLALLATGLTLLVLLPIYRKTRAAEGLLGIGAIISMLWSLTPFLMTGNIYYLSLGISLPIAATICGSVRLGIVFGCVFVTAGLSSAIALDQKWIVPNYGGEDLLRGYIEESIAVMVVMMFSWCSVIWVESKLKKAEINRLQSDAIAKKQLDGLKILVETTEELLTTEVQPESWIELLNRFAEHLGCDVITNYECIGDKLRLRAAKGLADEVKSEYEEIHFGEKVCGLCALTRKPIYLHDRNLATHEQGAALWAMGIKTVVAVPLLYGKQLIGTLAFGSTRKSFLSGDEIDFAKMIGQFVASIRGRELAKEVKDEALKRLEKLASRLPGVVYQFRVRPDGTFCFPYSSERMKDIHGVRPEDIVEDGSKVFAFHHPDDTAGLMDKIQRAVKELGQIKHEFRLRFGDGTIRWISINSIPESESDGSILFHGYMADVTDRVQAQQSLLAAHAAAESANRAKTEFLANMSHEIRTPMTAILGYADMLADEQSQPLTHATKTDCIETIKRNGEQLMSIINDILDISKIEADKLVVEHIEVSPLQIAQEVIELMKFKAQAKGLEMNLYCDSPVPKTVLTDPTRLRQILINLVGNSIKFTESGSVSVTMRSDKTAPSQLFFDVADTGIGIDPGQVSKLFRPFEQADASTTRKFGGTGLGLRISKRLSEMLGGNITVSSQPGVGSVFSLTIATGNINHVEHSLGNTRIIHKAEDPSLQTKQHTPQSHTPPIALSGLRILLVEDGPDNQRLIAFHLSKAGAEVQIAENGKKAVEMLCCNSSIEQELRSPLPFDMILMDMQMPEMDGYQATQMLRIKGLQIPILALTAHAMESDRTKCLEAGCDEWLTKPIERSELISACHEWLAKRDRLVNHVC